MVELLRVTALVRGKGKARVGSAKAVSTATADKAMRVAEEEAE